MNYDGSIFILAAAFFVIVPSLISALAIPPPASPTPKTYENAFSIPDPPLPKHQFTANSFDDLLLSIFRWTLQRQSGVISEVDGFEGMMAELHELRRTKGIDELQRVSSQTMTALAGPVPFLHRMFFKENEYSPALLALFAKYFLPFLVGDMTLTSIKREEDDISNNNRSIFGSGGGLLVERCRVLEGSKCKGICSKMCKVPTERFFAEKWGIPLSMEPNFETGACQLRFGVVPMEVEDDPTIPCGCLNRCPAAGEGGCN